MSDVEDRLQAWFRAEVSRAERDLAILPRAGAGTRPARRTAHPALVGALAVAIFVALALRPTLDLGPGHGPPGRPTSPPSSAIASTELGPDGLPAVVDGEHVLRVSQATTRLAAGPTQLLVAGWYSLIRMRCFGPVDTQPNPLLPPCNPARLSASREQVQAGLSVVVGDVPIKVGWVVVRVHTADPRAAECPAPIRDRCEAAIVVDEVLWERPAPAEPLIGRYLDGIPSEIEGELVFRAAQGRAAADARPDATPFLVGGWAQRRLPVPCPRPQDDHPLAWSCNLRTVGDGPRTAGGLALGPGPVVPDGPVVLRVHVHDPGAARCFPENRAACDTRIVVDEVAWAGDDLTSTRPLSIEDAIDAVSLELPAIGVEAVSVDRTCRRPLPAVVWQATGTSLIGSILVYSSVEAREAAGREPPFAPGCNGADALIVVPPSAIVDNVVVYTRFDDGTSDADRRALAATIEARLRATSEPTR